MCAGCHVGRDARDDLAVRDVNHDLIAAGHPRLNFEFTAYLENIPKHWKPGEVETAANFPARAWALGQLISAKAGLELLRSRCSSVAPASSSLPPALPVTTSKAPPWPEFAEYNCFSCHHDLADEPWRRARKKSAGRPGAPVWGSWYYPIAGTLVDQSAVGDDAARKQFQSVLQALAEEMGHPLPNSEKVRSSADVGINALDGLIRAYSSAPASSPSFSALGVEQWISVLNGREAWKQVGSWDEAAQRYLALVPLNQARARLSPERQAEHRALSEELRSLLEKLSYPKDFDSPRGFDPGRLR